MVEAVDTNAPRDPVTIEKSVQFDESAFAKLQDMARQMDDASFVDNLIERFLHGTPLRFEVLQAALQDGDCETLEFEAHTMKSGCGYVGALAMTELCCVMESHARAGRVDEAGAALAALRQSFGQVAERMRELLHSAEA